MSDGDEGIPEERPWRKREYSGASSTLGAAMLVVLAVAAAIWYFEFRGDSGNSLPDDQYGIVPLDKDKNPTGQPAVAEVGRAAPNFELQNLDGSTTRLSDLQGKTVVLNFWASWCNPCRNEAPELEALHNDNPDLVLIGVNQQENDAAARKFLDDFQLTYPVVMDRDGEVTNAYRVPGPPLTVIVGPDGVIQRMLLGGVKASDVVAAAKAIP